MINIYNKNIDFKTERIKHVQIALIELSIKEIEPGDIFSIEKKIPNDIKKIIGIYYTNKMNFSGVSAIPDIDIAAIDGCNIGELSLQINGFEHPIHFPINYMPPIWNNDGFLIGGMNIYNYGDFSTHEIEIETDIKFNSYIKGYYMANGLIHDAGTSVAYRHFINFFIMGIVDK